MFNRPVHHDHWLPMTLACAFLGCLALPVPAQQPHSSRILAFGTTSWTNGVATGTTLFEVDPGSAAGIPIPMVPHPGVPAAVGQGVAESAYDPVGGRWFLYDVTLGSPAGSLTPGTLLTIDAATGNVLAAVQPACWDLRGLQYETSTGRLLGIVCSFSQSHLTLSEIDPLTGAHTPIISVPLALVGATSTYFKDFTGLDPVNHLYLVRHGGVPGGSAVIPWVAAIDTISGVLVADNPTNIGFLWSNMRYDSVTGKIYVFSMFGAYTGAISGLATLNPMTAVGTPLPVGQGPDEIQILSLVAKAATLDQDRRTYHMLGRYVSGSYPVHSDDPRLFTFDLDSGHLLSDPIVDSVLPVYFHLVADTAGAPLRGRVTTFPNNDLVPGVSRTVLFDWAGHGGEFYIPFVSCNPGSFQVPGSNLSLPLAFDGCSQFYFTSPLSPFLFQLAPGGLQGLLSGPFGAAFGSVSLPAVTPPGLDFDLNIGFLTLTPLLQWSGAHGIATLHVKS